MCTCLKPTSREDETAALDSQTAYKYTYLHAPHLYISPGITKRIYGKYKYMFEKEKIKREKKISSQRRRRIFFFCKDWGGVYLHIFKFCSVGMERMGGRRWWWWTRNEHEWLVAEELLAAAWNTEY